MERPFVQIIDDKLSTTPLLPTYLIENQLNAWEKQYHTVAVMGCQSSGKSTILNYLFDTAFPIMNNKVSRCQTTKGVYISFHPDIKIFILDLEGTDSKERGDMGKKFEQSTALFALALSDILIINMWMSDIGRYNAANYELLKTVIEVSLRLFKKTSHKKLLFAIRDYDHLNVKEKMAAMLNDDLK